jgi:hypothetical protein
MGMVNPGQNWHFQRIGALVGCFPDLISSESASIRVISRRLKALVEEAEHMKETLVEQCSVEHNWAISPGAELQKRPLTCLEVEVL